MDISQGFDNLIHGKNEYKYQCNKCPFKAKKKAGLQIHTDAVHEKLKKYKCTACNKEYGYKGQLKQHVDTAHIEITHPCNKCDYKAANKQSLKIHRESCMMTLNTNVQIVI